MERNFMHLLRALWAEGKFVCVGLDPDYKKIPDIVKNQLKFGHYFGTSRHIRDVIISFNEAIVDSTKDSVCAYKLNTAFYEQYGADGFSALQLVIEYINRTAPRVPVILDAKRADIGNTNEGYVKMAFDCMKADAITVHPYLGSEAMKPFLDCKDKGIIVLCRTSNQGAGELQDWGMFRMSDEPQWLYLAVADAVKNKWNYNSNCLLVVGATYPDQLRKIRKIVGNMPILIPGIGAQGGDLEETLKVGLDSNEEGVIINSSRGIIYAGSGEDFAEAARKETLKLHDQIRNYQFSRMAQV